MESVLVKPCAKARSSDPDSSQFLLFKRLLFV